MEVKYKQGNTTAWSDGEKVVIQNETGFTHVKNNVEQIFGMGEFDELQKVAYIEEYDKKTFASPYELITGYIPARVKKDLLKQGVPGNKKKDYNEFF